MSQEVVYPVFNNTPLELLNQFLRGELAATATYEQAIDHVDDPKTRTVLEQCRQSHVTRAVSLAQEVKRRDAQPSETAGVWGAFTKLVEKGAAVFGEEAVLKTLQMGEREGLDSYETGMLGLDRDGRGRLEPVLVQAQRETLAKITKLAERSMS